MECNDESKYPMVQKELTHCGMLKELKKPARNSNVIHCAAAAGKHNFQSKKKCNSEIVLNETAVDVSLTADDIVAPWGRFQSAGDNILPNN